MLYHRYDELATESPQDRPPKSQAVCYSWPVKERVIRLLTSVVWAAVIGCLAGGLIGWVTAQFLHVPQVDQLATFQPKATTRILASDESQIASFAFERRVVLKPEQIPDHLKLAIVAIEDAQFYEHGGVDPKAILRAVVGSLKERKFGAHGGASTLTQQLARNLFLSRERKITRKIKEMLLALDIEKRLTKDQIITMYANQIFFGHGAYGVEAASQMYFGKPARDITIAEAALLAGMIQNPNRLRNPFRNPEGTMARRNKVLSSMLGMGFIDSEAYREAFDAPLGAAMHREVHDSGAYLLEMARQEIESRYGTDALYTAGLTATLTMDPQLQTFAEEALRNGLIDLSMEIGFRDPPSVVDRDDGDGLTAWEDPSWSTLRLRPGAPVHALVMETKRRSAVVRIGEKQCTLSLEAAKWTGTSSLGRILSPGDRILVRLPDELPEDPEAVLSVTLLQEPEIDGALVAMDNRTGAVRALVGGFDFNRSEFNCAVQARRQCGSAFKPFVYMTAFQQGYTPADTLFDAPFLLADAVGELTYCPKNFYKKYYGVTTLRRAMEKSYNATAVKLQQLVGGDAVVEVARKFGISTPLYPYPSLALGSLEVRLIDLVQAYAGIANMGEVPEPYFISQVIDREGRPKDRFFARTERAMPAQVTYLMVHVLRGVMRPGGTGYSAARLEANLGGKTGTTDDYTNAWFIGFSPRMTVGVWIGNPQLQASIGDKMTGAVAAQPIWNTFMERYLETLDEAARAEDFPVPPGVVFSPVERRTGLRAVPGCGSVVLEAFLDGTEPVESCDPELLSILDLPWPFQQPFYTPRTTEPMPTLESIAAADERLDPSEEEEGDGEGEEAEEGVQVAAAGPMNDSQAPAGR